MESKIQRILEIFYRFMHGEQLSIKELANSYQVSTKSISRDINIIKNFLSDQRDLVGYVELVYSYTTKKYSLKLDGFLENKELFAIIEILIGSRAIKRLDILTLIDKLKKFTTPEDRALLNEMIDKEIYHYKEVKSNCDGLMDNLWRLAKIIQGKKEITIFYTKMDHITIGRRIRPLAIVFSEYYYYLIAYHKMDGEFVPRYYRIDRINKMIEHREDFKSEMEYVFDEGALREKIQFMWPGKYRKITFEFDGPSIQAVLDRLPTAKVIKIVQGKYLIEAEVYGDGIIMYLLSQGDWVKVIKPAELVEEVKNRLNAMISKYNQ